MEIFSKDIAVTSDPENLPNVVLREEISIFIIQEMWEKCGEENFIKKQNPLVISRFIFDTCGE